MTDIQGIHITSYETVKGVKQLGKAYLTRARDSLKENKMKGLKRNGDVM